MRYSSILIGAAAFLSAEVIAFPAAAFEYADRARSGDLEARENIDAAIARYSSRVKRTSPIPFDAKLQYVSTEGQYAFVPPTATDARGPCPGLNAMANHGYIPHSGVADITQFITGTEKVFGMALDLGGFLAVFGATFDGNLLTWSIGGDNPHEIGTGDGLSNSHNKYENDASPTRGDLYMFGDDYKVQVSQFEQLYAMPLGSHGYDLGPLTQFRSQRFDHSIANNPYFFNGPFSGVIVQPAAYTFIYRFMGNKSAEYPEGYLDGETLKSFFSITGEPGSFVWTEGHERIPYNWYKRHPLNEYTIPGFLLDLLAAAAEYPKFLSIGGNTGKPDTFTPLNITNLISGVGNVGTLLESDNAICFAFQSINNAIPDLVKDLLTGVAEILGMLDPYIDKFLANITCPQLNPFDETTFNQYPGAKGLFP